MSPRGGRRTAIRGRSPATTGGARLTTTGGGLPAAGGGLPTTVGGLPTTVGGLPTTVGGRPTTGGGRPAAVRAERPAVIRGGRRAWTAVPLLALLLGGCGIRTTQVPTDFGPAPSRVPCALSGADPATPAGRGTPVQVFLLCASQLVTVDRSVRIPDGTAERQRRVLVAQGLLDQLTTKPSPAEKQAGYTTDVAGGIEVSGPRGADPADTFRLSARPQDLTSNALSQIVCTFAESGATAADDGTVVLGGPREGPLRRYECTAEVRARPGTVAPPSSEVTGS
jgi:hypothetical protein